MSRVLIAIVLAGMICFGTSVAAGQKTTRIRFSKGATKATISGTLNGYRSRRVFVIKVLRGQTLSTTQVGNSHDITIYIKSPAAEDVDDSDASCNNRREITPTDAGDYQITVVECQKADAWKGTFKFRVTVK
jgi:hypothetical protein